MFSAEFDKKMAYWLRKEDLAEYLEPSCFHHLNFKVILTVDDRLGLSSWK